MIFAPDPPPAAAAAEGQVPSSTASMETISQWVASQEVPSDLTVRIADSVFPLHKAVMVPKCGYIRRAVAASSNEDSTATVVELDLSALPGGADAFDKVTRYCYYGHEADDFEVTARDAVALRCAAAFLDMQPAADGGLARRVDEFLARAGLRTLPSAVAVLRSCEGSSLLRPAAEELGIVRRAADAVALKVCNEVMFPTTTRAQPTGWWMAELATLSPGSFGKVVTALRCRRVDREVIATAVTAYAELVLADVLLLVKNPMGRSNDNEEDVVGHGRTLLESVVDVLPSSTDAPLPAAFLCRLLHASVNTDNVSARTCRDLELRVAAVLDEATAGDLLGVALDGAGQRVTNTDTVRRVIAAFVERHAQAQAQAYSAAVGQSRSRRMSLSGGAEELGSSRCAFEKVARTVDELAAEIATEEALPVSKFVGVAGAVPKDAAARATHDLLYRAVDIYLKTHPALDEVQREKVCSVMDPLKLSHQARLHASQNKRLPLQTTVLSSALYFDQLQLRSAATLAAAAAADDDDDEEWDEWDSRQSSAAGKARVQQTRADASLARENEALRLELARMRAYVAGVQQQHNNSKGSGSSRASSSSSPPAAAKKKARFLGSVVSLSRTLSRLNPFSKGVYWAKDTKSSIADGRHGKTTTRDHHVVKPKRRRFSIG